MLGCERAGSADRAPPPRRTPPGGAPAAAGGAGALAGRAADTASCGGGGARRPCRDRTATLRDRDGTHAPPPRRTRRNYTKLAQSHAAPGSHTVSDVLSQRQHEQDYVIRGREVIRDSEECSKDLPSYSDRDRVTSSSSNAVSPHRSGWSSATVGWILSSHGGALLLCLLLLASIRGAAPAGGLGAGAVCARAPGLTERQRALCRAAPAAMPAIAAGLRAAFAECRAQLAGRRWNCSGVGDHNLFAHVVPLATREAAFTYALASAGVTHALSAACARGELPACGCAHRRRGAGAQWEWGAEGARCGDAAYGARLARRFLDARELERDARALMNLHNNRLGRKMVKELVRVECKCHGVSGSCSVRTCWRALPPLGRVARALRDKYLRARLVAAEAPPGGALVLRRARGGRAPRRSELVFLAASPSYCEADAAAAAPGTRGRACNRSSVGEDGCGALCCGRGHSTVRAVTRRQCRCTFHWCCRVSCDTCLLTTDLHICN